MPASTDLINDVVVPTPDVLTTIAGIGYAASVLQRMIFVVDPSFILVHVDVA